ncbi:MAG: hypothetical protein K2H60_02270 [Muribaculaceae bacterium]|nr:hypothetical protein [Muribaculaceae bacterium]
MKIYIYTAAALLGFSTLALTSCQNENEPDNVSGNNKVLLTINANRGESETRTTFEDNGEGGLNCYWSEGDQLVVADSKGKKIGVVTLESVDENNKSRGVFKGEVELGSEGNINLIYVGSSAKATDVASSATYIDMDLSKQDGSLVSLTGKDILCAETDVTTVNGTATADVSMNRRVAHGYFTLNFTNVGGLDLKADDVITITSATSTSLQSQGKVNFKNGGNIPSAATYTGSTSITITKTEDGNSFYVTVLPIGGAYEVTPIFTVIKDGYKYTASLGSHKWLYGEYVRKNTNGDPVEVNTWTKKKFSENAALTDNWGSSEDTKIDLSGSVKKVADADGWTTNINIYNQGGWATYYTYKQNAIVDNLLSSTDNGGAFYFQWGRWLGFPSACVNTYFQNEDVKGSYPTSAQHLPGNPHNHLNIGYIGNSRLMVTYISGYMGGNDSFTRQKAINWSTMFAMVTGGFVGNWDYIYSNEECEWEDRSGNPCPDGFRLPTVDEISVLIPSTGKISKSYAEVKTVSGKKYAMQWKTGSDDTNYVEVKSVETTKNSVSVDDPIFTDVRGIKLYAYGFIAPQFRPAQKLLVGQLGMYWTNESGKNTYEGTNGYGAKYLRVVFDSANEVRMDIQVAPRTFGGCVLPLVDPNAKSASVTPWLPYYSI